MKPRSLLPLLAVPALLACRMNAAFAQPPDSGGHQLAVLQRELVNLRFGMFIHFSPTTYLDVPDHLRPDHAPPRQGKDDVLGTADDLSPALLNPTRLDCDQWAKAAASAKMGYAVLTTKHHDGFCLWPSKYSTYTVAQGCRRDVVREYAEAFRRRGLKVGLYYSIRDRTERIAGVAGPGGVSSEHVQLIKNQLTELLTGYGDILCIVFDGWGNTWHESPTFSDLSYAEIRAHIKALQPDCLVLNHSRLRSVSDVLQIELHAGMTPPTGSDWPAVGGTTLQDQWFWRSSYPTSALQSVKWIVQDNLVPYNERNMVFQLNCAPNRDGLLDANVVERLAEVGRAWTPPPPLESIPDSWRDWPVPSTIKRFQGENLALGRSARSWCEQRERPAPLAVDGDPETAAELSGTNAWLDVDLGQSYALAGLHLWNRAALKSQMLDRGFLFVSEQPFLSNEPERLRKQAGVATFAITEPPGYPTPLPIGVRGRYLRIVSGNPQKLGLGEVEVFAGGATSLPAAAPIANLNEITPQRSSP